MTTRYDLIVGRKGKDDKTYWTNIGVMWPQRDKDGFKINLHALPLTDSEGRCSIMAVVPKPRDDVDRQKPARQSSAKDDMDSDIPF